MSARRRQAALFAGVAGTAAACVLPDGFLPVHMAAHALLVSLAAPLVVFGLPRRAATRLAGLHPAAAWSAFVGAQWAFHLGPLFPRMLEQPALDQLEHAILLATAVVFWLPVAGRRPLRHPLDGPGRTLYLFLALPATDLVGLWFMASGRVAAGTAMIAAMLPLGAAAFAATWRWVAREEDRMIRWERYGGSPG